MDYLSARLIDDDRHEREGKQQKKNENAVACNNIRTLYHASHERMEGLNTEGTLYVGNGIELFPGKEFHLDISATLVTSV